MRVEPRPSTARGAGRLHDGDATPPSRIEPTCLFAWQWAILRSCYGSFRFIQGRAPRLEKRRKPAALKARFTFWASSMHDLTLCPNSLRKGILHIIFSTKNREPWRYSNVRRSVEAIVCHQILPQNVGIATTLENSLYSIVNQELRLIDAKSSVGTPYVSQRH